MRLRSKNLKQVGYLLVETKEHLNFCSDKGLKDSTKVLSFNPYLVLNKKLNIYSPEEDLGPEHYNKLSLVTKNYSGKVFNKVLELTKDRSYAHYLATYFISLQNVFFKTATLIKFIKNKKLIIITPDYSNKKLNNKINNNFNNFIECFDNINLFKLKYKDKDQERMGRDPVPKFIRRLIFEGINSISFRIITILCNNFIDIWPRQKILYSHENTLLKGTASYLFRKGYFLEKIKYEPDLKYTNNQNTLDSTFKIIQPIMKKYMQEIIGSKVNDKAIKFINDLTKDYMSDYINAKFFWNNYFNNKKNKVKACLIGTPTSAIELSCIEVAKNNSVLTASFQHGITKEISDDILNIDTSYESNVVDKFFVFNNEAAKNSKKSRFNFAEEHEVGLPEDMKKNLTKQKYKMNMQPILYATTTLYCGHRGIPGRSGSNDIYKANFEINLVDKVFSKLPYKIHYKPYFSKRFPGPNIELELARKKSNIYINENEIDLRYIIGNSRIIITSRATSTIGWCMLSGKPVIYIENEDNRLNKFSRKAFEENLFFFDVKDENWDKNLLKFLSFPLEDIEKQWKEKEKTRKLFIEKYFGSNQYNAEKKCAKILLNTISKIKNI